MVVAVLVACEIGFWAFLLAGLLTRYVVRARRVSVVLLVLAPMVDAVLLAVTALDLHGGGTANWSHGLAALYIGLSVAFGHRLIRSTDVRFARRFAGGPAPRRPTGVEYAKVCWADAGRAVIAAAVAAAITGALIWWIGDPGRTQALLAMYPTLGTVVAAFTLWAVSYTIWPRKPKRAAAEVP
jgi:hypothetical protein